MDNAKLHQLLDTPAHYLHPAKEQHNASKQVQSAAGHFQEFLSLTRQAI